MQLTDKIHLLKLDFEIHLAPEKKLQRFVNAFIILGEKITLIDTGVKSSAPEIINYLRSCGRDISELETILLSHSHPDHIGSAARLKELSGCKILAHDGEKDWIENIQTQNAERPVPGFFNLVDTSVEIDMFISNEQTIKVDRNITLKIIHSPGHSKGSINILFQEDRIFFTADSIPLKNDIPNYDCYSDLASTLENIKTRNDYDILLTSWTPPLFEKSEIDTIISDGETYMRSLDKAVKASYLGEEPHPLEFCKNTLANLGLPPFMAMPIVDRAFKSHFIK